MAETLNLYGGSGRLYSFQLYSYGTKFGSGAGVYVITTLSTPGKHVINYVGQTADFGARFTDHHKEDCFQRQRSTHIAVLGNTSEQQRLDIERDIVQKYAPTCNG